MDKINRMAANFGIDEAFAAAVQEHLKTIGEIPPDDEQVEADGGVDLARAPECMREASALETSPAESEAGSGFFDLNRS
jgi:hypothetical protein